MICIPNVACPWWLVYLYVYVYVSFFFSLIQCSRDSIPKTQKEQTPHVVVSEISDQSWLIMSIIYYLLCSRCFAFRTSNPLSNPASWELLFPLTNEETKVWGALKFAQIWGGARLRSKAVDFRVWAPSAGIGRLSAVQSASPNGLCSSECSWLYSSLHIPGHLTRAGPHQSVPMHLQEPPSWIPGLGFPAHRLHSRTNIALIMRMPIIYPLPCFQDPRLYFYI